MGCSVGECHRVGDEKILADAGVMLFDSDNVNAGTDGEGDGYADEEDGYEDMPDDEYGEDDEYGQGNGSLSVLVPATDVPPGGAPNLQRVSGRLQRNWVEWWIQHAMTMQPGTRMQQKWEEDKSAFVDAGDNRQAMETLYGATAEEQKKILVDWLYNIHDFTYAPDGTRLVAPAPEAAKTVSPQLPEHTDQNQQ